MSLKEINGKLTAQPYVAGFVPSTEDAKTFADMFGENVAVAQWAARMASYYQAERDELVNPPKKVEKKEEKKPAAAEEDDDIDLFGEETEEDKAALEAKKKADAAKAAALPKKSVIAKSSILVDIKPWDDTIDLEELSKKLKAVEKDGLLWGAHKLVPVAFGVKKLQMLIVIEDDKVSGDDLEDIITGFEDDVQSMDIQAWNKV